MFARQFFCLSISFFCSFRGFFVLTALKNSGMEKLKHEIERPWKRSVIPFANLAYQTYPLTPALHTSCHSRRSYGLHANCFEMATFMNFYLVIIRAVLRLHATLNSD